MACNKNINSLIDLDFSAVNDEFNWVNNTDTPIETISGQLRFIPESISSQYSRGLGNLDAANNRIRLQLNMDVFRPQASPDETFCATFGIYLGATLIDEFTLYVDGLASGERAEYNLDRLYSYQGVGGAISLKITTIEGIENQLFLDYLKAEDSNFCDDDVRVYFVIDNFLADAIGSVSSAVQLLEWKVDDVETLTPLFFTENPTPGGDPSADWKRAKADIDGQNRDANTVDPNTFNPFATEWGLDFVDVAGNHFGGKPTGTTSGGDYGSGILQIGFEKPTILNELLDQKDGAFFIDIDYTKNLKIVFNILVNNTDSNPFNSPDIYRRFTILWDAADLCAKQFYFNDVLDNDEFQDEIINGFLSGITGKRVTQIAVDCNDIFSFAGNAGTFEFPMDFGSGIGIAGIDYQAFNLPDKFEIEWDGKTFSSGYVGLDVHDQALLNLGISPSEIKTDNPSSGMGTLSFNKTTAQPETGIIRVTAPLAGTAWQIDGICPGGTISSAVEVGEASCGNIPGAWTPVFISDPDPANYVPANLDVIYTDSDLTAPFDGEDKTFLMRVTIPPFQKTLNYQFQIDANGVISAVQLCQDDNGDDGIEPVIDDLLESVSSCYSCWIIRIKVPAGEQRKVTITSAFALGAVYAAGACDGENPVIANVDETISATKDYTMGIDAATGAGNTTSTLTVIVKDINDLFLSQKIFSRDHINANC